MITSRFEKITKDNLGLFLCANADLISQSDSSLWLHKSTYWIQSWLEAFDQRMHSEGEEPWAFLAEQEICGKSSPLGLIFLTKKGGVFPVVWGSAGKIFGSPGPLILKGKELEFLNTFLTALKNESRFYFLDLAPTNEPWVESPFSWKLSNLRHPAGLEISKFIDAPFLDLVNFEGVLSKKMGDHLSRIKRNFDKKNYTTEVSTFRNESINEKIDLLYAMHALSWPKSIFNIWGGVYRDFFTRLNRINLEFSTRLDVLRINGDVAALVFGIIIRDRYYYLVPTYSVRFKEYSPGSLLILELISDLRQSGIKVFDFMNSLEPYKLKWTEKVMPRYKYIFFSHRLFSPNIVYFMPRFKAKLTILKNRLGR